MNDRRRFLLTSVASGLAVLLATAPASGIEGQYHGRVIDAESKQPLEGAVVTVIWMKAPWFSMDGVKDFHQAREKLTDAEGKFTIDAKPHWAIRYVDREPEIIVYKPGYGRYPDMYFKMNWPGKTRLAPIEEELQARRPVTIELPKLQTRPELALFASPSLPSRVPDDEVPILRRLTDELRVSLGMEPLQSPTDAKRERR